jgi:hypothetical protein
MPFPAAAGAPGGQLLPLVIGVAVAAIIMLLRNRQARRLRIERLWIRPVLFGVIVTLSLLAAPPPAGLLTWALLNAGLAIGAVLGWQRGRLMRITVDPETHELTSQMSALGQVFVLGLVLLRMGLRSGLAGGAHLPLAAITGGLLLMAAGMVCTQGLEMWLRARRMLAEAEAARAAAPAAEIETVAEAEPAP